MALEITTKKLKDGHFTNWSSEVEDRWNYEDFRKDENWRKDWISFDCLCYVEANDTVYSGITSFDADIFWGYDRSSCEWVSTGYDRVADPFDAKFHRSLELYEGKLYGAIALLHDIDRYWDAPGGAIVQYDPITGDIKKLAIPLPHQYIQSIAIDRDRGILYGQTFTPERLFSFHLTTDAVKDLGPIGSGLQMGQGENITLDDAGNVWGSWSLTRAWQTKPGVDSSRLFRYRPDTGRIEFFEQGLTRPDGEHGNVKIETIMNLGTDCLYASGGNGSLYRLDPKTGKTEYLFTAVADRPSRLTSLARNEESLAYGVVGREGDCELMEFNLADESYTLKGKVVDGDGVACFQCHHILRLQNGDLFVGENDVPHRSGYLWEIKNV